MCHNHSHAEPKSFAPVCFFVPPYVLRELAKNGAADAQDAALRTLATSAAMRTERDLRARILPAAPLKSRGLGVLERMVYDAKNNESLPGVLVRKERARKRKDAAVNEAYTYSGDTWKFFKNVLKRDSIDDRGLRLDSTVHYGEDFDNAFWNGEQMVYGDGDGVIFERFTKSLDVIGHELTHGVTQYEAGLIYQGQPGALNEHMSDVFGTCLKQWKLKQTPDKADWIIGAGLFAKGVNGVGIRSMKAPGTAYDDPRLGKDPQPDHMKKYVYTNRDNGGVHINSGIPNKAFYLAATALGGRSWEKAGKIWYVALRDKLRPRTDFRGCADMTVAAAGELYGADSAEQKAVREAWKAVGVLS